MREILKEFTHEESNFSMGTSIHYFNGPKEALKGTDVESRLYDEAVFSTICLEFDHGFLSATISPTIETEDGYTDADHLGIDLDNEEILHLLRLEISGASDAFTPDECLKELKNIGSEDRRGVMILDVKEGIFYGLEFGTGDNLLPEDIADGNNDYIEVQGYEYDAECQDLTDSDRADGGEFMFNNEARPSDDINEFVFDALTVCTGKCPRFMALCWL